MDGDALSDAAPERDPSGRDDSDAEAVLRLQAYLSAWGVTDPGRRAAIAGLILERAADRSHRSTDADRVERTIEAAQQWLDERLAALAATGEAIGQPPDPVALRAALLGGGFARWPSALLHGGSRAAEIGHAALLAAPRPLPPEQPLMMEAQPIELRFGPGPSASLELPAAPAGHRDPPPEVPAKSEGSGGNPGP